MAKRTAKKHVKAHSSKKLRLARHAASVKRVSSERGLHHMIRLVGALFPIKQDKDTKKSLEVLSDLAKKRGFKSFYGLLQGLLAENAGRAQLEKASDTAINIFQSESGVNVVERTNTKHEKKKGAAHGFLRRL